MVEREEGWRRELVDAAVRRHERLSTHMSVGMVGHAQALQRLLHPALSHLVQLALDAVEVAARIRPPTHQSSSQLPVWLLAVLRVLLRCVRSVIRALRHTKAALLMRLLHASARIQAYTTRFLAPPHHTQGRSAGGAEAGASASRSRGSRLRHAVAAALTRSLASLRETLQALLTHARQQCGDFVTAPQYASFLLFAIDVAAVLKTGSFPEELCLGLRRQPLRFANTAAPAQLSLGGMNTLLRTLVLRGAHHAAGLGAAVFRAWLRQAENRSAAVTCVRDAVELGVLVASALQLRSYTSLDAVFFSAGVTDAATAREERNRQLTHETERDRSRVSTTGRTQPLPSREEFDAWIADQQRQHLLETASPARRAVSVVASTVFAAVPPLVIGALPRIVEWLDQLQRAAGERRLSAADRALRGNLNDGSERSWDGSLAEQGDGAGEQQEAESQQQGAWVAEGGGVLAGNEQEEDGEAWDQEATRGPRGGGLDPAQQRQQRSFLSVLLGVGDVQDEAGDELSGAREGEGCEEEAALPSPHETVAAALDVKEVMNCCALCRRKPTDQPCVVPTAGMLCCMPCAVQAVRDANNRCPFTGHPLNPATQLIRIYDSEDSL